MTRTLRLSGSTKRPFGSLDIALLAGQAAARPERSKLLCGIRGSGATCSTYVFADYHLVNGVVLFALAVVSVR
ncbi:hypothetical protein ACIQWB_37930 [Streptomyces olivaceus]|uniref:hypothetical protein n=1 Tax=Streptomyces olivaceus TaxID=47716 RepID=UPI00382943C5